MEGAFSGRYYCLPPDFITGHYQSQIVLPKRNDIAAEEYILSFQRGEERGYDYFFRFYFKALCFFAGSILHNEQDAEDVVQSCFANLWQRHSALKSPNSIRAFLFTSVRNACISRLRKNELSIISMAENFENNFELTVPDYEKLLIQAEMLRDIYAAGELLTGRIKEVFQFSFIEGKTDLEISLLLNTSHFTVRNQRKKAIELLRNKILKKNK